MYRLYAPNVYCFARFWWRVLLSCRLARLDLNSVSVSFRPAVLLIFHCLRPTYSFVFDRGETIGIWVQSDWVHRFCTPRVLSRKILMTCPLSCRLARLDLNSVQLSISFKHGVLWRLHGRISSFWTSPGRSRRIIAMPKSGVGDVSMRTTAGVALWRGKPRGKYFSSLHLTRWTDHLEPKKYFILALHRMITSPAVLLKSQRLRGNFRMDSRHWNYYSATGLNWAVA